MPPHGGFDSAGKMGHLAARPRDAVTPHDGGCWRLRRRSAPALDGICASMRGEIASAAMSVVLGVLMVATPLLGWSDYPTFAWRREK